MIQKSRRSRLTTGIVCAFALFGSGLKGEEPPPPPPPTRTLEASADSRPTPAITVEQQDFVPAFTDGLAAGPVQTILTDERGVWKKAIALTVDAAFMRPPVAEPLAGAKATVVSVSVIAPSGTTSWLDAEDFKKIGGGISQFLPATAALAAKLIEKHPPRLERDSDQVIRYAVLESESPFMASAIFAPNFLDTFRETIGPVLEVVIPSRNRLFIFPPGDAAAFGEVLWGEFRAAIEPVSLEVFEITRQGITFKGTLRP